MGEQGSQSRDRLVVKLPTVSRVMKWTETGTETWSTWRDDTDTGRLSVPTDARCAPHARRHTDDVGF